MAVRLTILDVLGYTDRMTNNPTNFKSSFNKYLNSFLKQSPFNLIDEHEIYRHPEDKDAFYVLSNLIEQDSLNEMINFCRLISYRQVYSVLYHRFLLRGYSIADKTYFLNKTFNSDSVSEEKYEFLYQNQRGARFPRIKLDKSIINHDAFKECHDKRYICKVNSRSKTYYINPFLAFYDDFFNSDTNPLFNIRDYYYEALYDSISYLLLDVKKRSSSSAEPYKKVVWFALQFDYATRKTNLPYKPLLIGRTLRYAYVYLRKNQKSLEEFVNFKKTIFSYFDSKDKEKKTIINLIKNNYVSDASYRQLDALFYPKDDRKIPFVIVN